MDDLVLISRYVHSLKRQTKLLSNQRHNLMTHMKRDWWVINSSYFLPRCIECRCGLAMRILSVHLPNACTVTKRKTDLSRISYHTKDHLA